MKKMKTHAKKLNLKQLKVRSFITSLNDNEKSRIKSAMSPPVALSLTASVTMLEY